MDNFLSNRKIILGVSSGIAIYKAVDLASKLRKLDVELNVILTKDANNLISKSVFQAVGNCNAYIDIYDLKGGWIPHTDLSLSSDILIIAPATANTIAKIANGVSDNLLTATALAFNKEFKIIIPTMNIRMYENKITQQNIQKLKDLGWFVMDPEEGHLACGEIGKGRYPKNENILEFLEFVLSKKDYLNKKVLISAGPTIEDIDPVRFISNYSSGKMGYALASEFSNRGAEVEIVSGPVNLKQPYMVKKIHYAKTADDMYEIINNKKNDFDIIIMSAAISDFKPEKKLENKIKKNHSIEKMKLNLIKNIDILKTLSNEKKKNQLIIGFAAETENIIEYGKAKLRDKNLDLIIINDVSRKDLGFSSDYNEITIISEKGEKVVKKNTKKYISISICDYIINNFFK